MTTSDFIKQVQTGEVDVVEHTHKVFEEVKKLNKEYKSLEGIVKAYYEYRNVISNIDSSKQILEEEG